MNMKFEFRRYVGDEDSVFDNWFDELNIPKPSVAPKRIYHMV